jgi:hypothetical protein
MRQSQRQRPEQLLIERTSDPVDRLSSAHRDLLNPYGEIFGQMNEKVFDLPDADLKALGEAVDAVDSGNCWCMIYDAAKWLRVQIDEELARRIDRDTALKASQGKVR